MTTEKITLLKKNDLVQVMAGRSKGKRGKIISLADGAPRAFVEKVNLIKRHTRPTQKTPQGGIVEKEANIHLSNLMVVCSHCGKPVRLGVEVDKGQKRRICKKCKKAI